MAGADVSGILLVVIKIFLVEDAVFVTDQPVCGHFGGVEFDLDLDVFGDGDQRTAHLADQDFSGFRLRIDVGVIAVALVGELLHAGIFIVAHAESQHA